MSTTVSNQTRPRDENGRFVARTDKQPARDALSYVREYAREKPDVAALWCFGIGFVVGWRLKPW